MADDYRAQGVPFLIFSHNIDDTEPLVRQRASQWRQAAGVPPGTGATLPLVLVNGGRETTQGAHADFRRTYSQMMSAAGASPATADVSARWRTVNDQSVRVTVTVTNTGEAAFDPFEGGNDARVLLFAVERAIVIHLKYYANHNQILELPDVLKPGQAVTLEATVPVRSTAMRRTDLVAVLEYVKDDGKWDVAQGAIAMPDAPAAPPTPTPVPTVVAAPEPTDPAPAAHRILLPVAHSGGA